MGQDNVALRTEHPMTATERTLKVMEIAKATEAYAGLRRPHSLTSTEIRVLSRELLARDKDRKPPISDARARAALEQVLHDRYYSRTGTTG